MILHIQITYDKISTILIISDIFTDMHRYKVMSIFMSIFEHDMDILEDFCDISLH